MTETATGGASPFRRLAGASGINLVMQLSSTALGLITGLVLSRLLGASGLGIYAFALALANVLSVVARLGLEQLLVREIAVANEAGAWPVIKGLVRFAEWASAATALAVGGIAWLVLSLTSDAETAGTVAAAVVLLFAMSNLQLRNAALRGLDRVVAAQIPVLTVRPVGFLLLLGALFLVLPELSPMLAMSAHAVAYLGAWALSIGMWLRYRPASVAAVVPAYDPRRWMASAMPLMVMGGLSIINNQADILMLKWLASDASTGIYSVANQFARFTAMVLPVVNAVVASRFAALHASGKREELQDLVTASSAGITAATLPIAAALLILGPVVLSWYGEEFVAGYAPLAILVLSQLVNALSGSVGLLLVMSGHERVVGWVSTGTAALNIALNLLLIPRFDMVGAAFATATVMITWNVVLIFRVRAVLGLQSTALAWVVRWWRRRKTGGA